MTSFRVGNRDSLTWLFVVGVASFLLSAVPSASGTTAQTSPVSQAETSFASSTSLTTEPVPSTVIESSPGVNSSPEATAPSDVPDSKISVTFTSSSASNENLNENDTSVTSESMTDFDVTTDGWSSPDWNTSIASTTQAPSTVSIHNENFTSAALDFTSDTFNLTSVGVSESQNVSYSTETATDITSSNDSLASSRSSPSSSESVLMTTPSTPSFVTSTESPGSSTESEEASGSGLSSGSQAAIAICVILVVVAAAVGAIYFYKRRYSKPYETLDDYGAVEGLQNPTYDIDL